MIPLAQYLTEFEDEQDIPFQSLKAERFAKGAKPAKPAKAAGRTGAAAFEHLTLVAEHGKVKRKPPVLRGATAIPEMSEDEADAGPLALLPGGFDEAPLADLATEITGPSDEDVEAAREAGREQGRAAAIAEMQAQQAHAVVAALEAERARAAKERAEALEKARAEWCASEGEALAKALTDRLDRIETALRTSFASVLKPVAFDARTRRTVMELADAVATLGLDGEALSLHATGPEALLDAFVEALGARRKLVTVEVDEDASDIRIVCAQTTLESRLGSWKTALEEALA
ncbi:hypothetical protein [Aurantimonas sp. VKM B-3413]|uniref:hypothetical protein n=1 Tax=Aurantimonas sp. VKM B-3413 TaxID=2779401 RepID=UPI001E5052D7|nr:hypothetical protein [Aurantimonas sp. VKM B-3413]MCB8838139.1 hypothetical protein [Aurantimonas sp. VKM B-3413]